MNKTFYSIILAAAIAAGCSTTYGPEAKNEFQGINLASSREVVLTVHGLSCPLCSNNLDGQLTKINGVESAGIDLKTGAVTVLLSEGHSVTSGDFADAVRHAGFTLKKIHPKEPKQ